MSTPVPESACYPDASEGASGAESNAITDSITDAKTGTSSVVVLWLADARLLPPSMPLGAERMLGVSEYARYAGFRRLERQRQYLLGHLLLRHAASCLMGVAFSRMAVIEQPGAGPRVNMPDGAPVAGVSIAHSRHWIACAVSSGMPLGLDIEVIDDTRDIAALADAAFSEDEAAWVKHHATETRIAAFYQCWTMKEALIKLWSNSANRKPLPALVDAQGHPCMAGPGWHARALPHLELAIAICGGAALPTIAVHDATPVLSAMLAGASSA